ncbi:MAG: hypothetical protein H0V39_06195 [Nitrosomonas sp.]|nr:hypothetical protein [Nitrosomonas sp.]
MQKLWPAGGKAALPDHIRYLEEHRHHGLDFFIMIQAPSFVHSHVLNLVEKHLHILSDWTGRKLYEWSEYCSTVRSKTAKDQAVKQRYKLPKQSFALYHSSTKHIKPEKTIPKMLFVTFFTFLIFPFLVYFAFDRVTSKAATEEKFLAFETVEDEIKVSHQAEAEPEAIQEIQETVISPELPTLVSSPYDWHRVSACLESQHFGCVCYGTSGERLAIPLETCKTATRYGWPAKPT